MKYILALFAFIIALSLSIQTVANSESEDSKACKPEENKKCGPASHDAPNAKNSKDWTHKRLEQVAAILPEKQQDKNQVMVPEKTKLISPKFLSVISGTTTKLEWSETKGAKFYHIQVSKDAGFNNRSMYVADEKWVKGTSFEVTNLEVGQKYFWRVAAVNNENDSMFTKSLFASSAFETK